MRHDAADGEGVVRKIYVVTDLHVSRLRHDIIGKRLVCRFKRAAGAVKKTAAESVETLVVDAVNHHEALLIHQDKRR